MITPVEFHERRRAELLLDPPCEWASVGSWLAALQELDHAILLLKLDAVRTLQRMQRHNVRWLRLMTDGPEVRH